MPHPLTLAAASAALVLLAACGGDDDDATSDADRAPSADGVVSVVAEDIDFDADSYEAEAGTVTFEYANEGAIEHTLLIDGIDGFGLVVESRGDTDQGSVELEAGTYRLYCDLPGHEQAGMVADLEVG